MYFYTTVHRDASGLTVDECCPHREAELNKNVNHQSARVQPMVYCSPNDLFLSLAFFSFLNLPVCISLVVLPFFGSSIAEAIVDVHTASAALVPSLLTAVRLLRFFLSACLVLVRLLGFPHARTNVLFLSASRGECSCGTEYNAVLLDVPPPLPV